MTAILGGVLGAVAIVGIFIYLLMIEAWIVSRDQRRSDEAQRKLREAREQETNRPRPPPPPDTVCAVCYDMTSPSGERHTYMLDHAVGTKLRPGDRVHGECLRDEMSGRYEPQRIKP
jgi:hypothetical protein